MKLKLLFFMGILSVFCNTMNAGISEAVSLKPVSLPPTISADKLVPKLIDNQLTCPGIIVANIVFYINDDQTIFPNLIVTAKSDNQALLPDSNLSIFLGSLGDRFLTVTTIPGILGDANVTLTVEDGDGQKTSTTFKVTTQDLAPPTLTSVNNKNENVDSACEFSIPDYTTLTVASDDCLAPIVTQSPLAGTSISGAGLQQVVTLTATDGVGKTASTTFTITLIDDIAPILTSSGDINVDQDPGTCSALVNIVDATATDNCTLSGSPSAVRDDAKLLTDAFPVGVTTITWTVSDTSGNVASTTQTVTVKDIINPTATAQDKTVYLDETGNVTIVVGEIDNNSTDNCTITSRILDKYSFDCTNLFVPNTVVLTVTDASGNVASDTAIVTVVDNIKPVITTSGDQTVSNDAGVCGALVTVVAATATDNCTSNVVRIAVPGLNPTGIRSDFPLALGDEYPVGVTTITWTVSDASGNIASTTQTVTVNDTENPVITTSGDQIVSNDAGVCGALVEVVAATATDNCTSPIVRVAAPVLNPIGTRNDALALDALYPLGTTTITWTVSDVAGNSASTTQTVTVNDTTPPNVIPQDITVQLDDSGNVTITPSQVDNGSTDNCGTTASLTLTLDITSFDCSKTGPNTVTLTVTDSSGNAASATATVTVIDAIAPVITCNANITTSSDAGICGAVVTYPLPTVTDNCPSTSNLVVNGSFESGLSNWTTDNGTSGSGIPVAPNCDQPWTAAASGPNCAGMFIPNPIVGANAAYTAFDGFGPTVYTMSQSITLPAGVTTADLSWLESYSTDGLLGAPKVKYSGLPRQFNIDLYDAANTVLIANLNSQTLPYSASLSWTPFNADVSAVIAAQSGNTVTLRVSASVPENFTGPAGFGFDNVSLNVNNVQLVQTAGLASGSSFPLGTTTNTFVATDASGNTASCSFDVTVNDTEKPQFTTGFPNLFVDIADGLEGKCRFETSLLEAPLGTDNCATTTITVTPEYIDISAGPDHLPSTVTWTITDGNGNSATATQNVTVEDYSFPVVHTKDVTKYFDANGQVVLTPDDIEALPTTDNCIKSRVVVPNIIYCGSKGPNTVALIATDTYGNQTIMTAIVTALDNVAPTITTSPITVNTNSGCTWSGTLALPVTADNQNCSVVSVTSDAPLAFPLGNTTVTWTASDDSGNTASATQIVTVKDATPPVAKAADITVRLNVSSVTITPTQVNAGSTDNCGTVASLVLALSKTSFDCTNVGPNRVTLKVTDESGNFSTVDAIVTVIDDIKPVITANGNKAVNTNSGCVATAAIVSASATATDNCTLGSLVPVGTRSDAKALTADYPLGRTIITWNITDSHGILADPVLQTVDVTDNVKPVIVSNGLTKNVNVDANSCGAIVNVSATATDNCSVGAPTGVRSDSQPLAAPFLVGTTTIRWNVTDVNSNLAVEVVQTVTVTDNVKPVITANGDKNVTSDANQCGALVAVSATATDNCTVVSPVGVRYFNGASVSDGLLVTAPYAVGTTIIKWNVTDANTNAAVEVLQTVVVRDVQIPVITGTIVNIDVNTDATACGATVSVTPPTATDNCTPNTVIGTRSDNLALTALYPLGTTTITWKASDVNGNVALPTTTTVKVKDVTGPVVITKAFIAKLNAAGIATVGVADVNDGSNDPCGIASYSLDKTSFSCTDTGSQTVRLTVIDVHGNSSFKDQVITVVDQILPVARALTTITLELNATGSVSIAAVDLNNGSTDNCSIASYTIGGSATRTFTCASAGTSTTLQFKATDASGNISLPVDVVINVLDKIAPTVVTKPYTAQLNALGTVTIVPANVNNGSTDNCSITTYSLSKDTFTCANVGSNVISLTVTDASGNTKSAFATVTVQDVTPPVVVTKDISLVLDHGSVSIVPGDVLVSATDACGVKSYTLSKDTFTIVDVLASPVTITVFATDINGNVGSATATVTFPRPITATQVITPNGDGINDTWVVDNITNHLGSVVRVFNRWGSLVYSAKNYQNDWDGKLNGSDTTVPDAGSYYYQIDLDGTGRVDSEGWLFISRQ